MKKLTYLLLCGLLMVGCGKTEEVTDNVVETSPLIEVGETDEATDKVDLEPTTEDISRDEAEDQEESVPLVFSPDTSVVGDINFDPYILELYYRAANSNTEKSHLCIYDSIAYYEENAIEEDAYSLVQVWYDSIHDISYYAFDDEVGYMSTNYHYEPMMNMLESSYHVWNMSVDEVSETQKENEFTITISKGSFTNGITGKTGKGTLYVDNEHEGDIALNVNIDDKEIEIISILQREYFEEWVTIPTHISWRTNDEELVALLGTSTGDKETLLYPEKNEVLEEYVEFDGTIWMGYEVIQWCSDPGIGYYVTISDVNGLGIEEGEVNPDVEFISTVFVTDDGELSHIDFQMTGN